MGACPSRSRLIPVVGTVGHESGPREDRMSGMPEGTAAPRSRPSLETKVGLHLFPLLIAAYFVAFLDRTNIAFAGPNGMNHDLGLSPTLFGFAAGVFFIGYILF